MQANPVNYRQPPGFSAPFYHRAIASGAHFPAGERRCQATGLFVYPANDLHKAQLLTQLITSHGGIGSGKIIIALLPL